MLGVDPKRVAVAEPSREVSVKNDNTWCGQFATVKQSFYFIEIIKNIKHKHKRGMSVQNKFCFSL
jgi:hypothetical protein